MSKISLAPDVAGTGIFTIASPNSNTNRTLTLPDDTGTIVTNSGNQAGSFTTLNTSGQVVFNDAGADVDFRVEGDTEANLLFVDASTDRVGVGTNTPSGLFDVASRGITKGSLPAGSVLQVISTTKTDTFSTASTSLVDVTGLTVSITPTSATSKILVFVVASGGGEEATNGMNLALLRGATQISLGDASGSRSRGFGGNQQITNALHTNTAVFLDSPATTSATTYKVQASVNTGTGYINRNHNDADSSYNTRGVSSITVMEIAA